MKFSRRNITLSVFVFVWLIVAISTTRTFASAFVVSPQLQPKTTTLLGRFERSNTNSYQNRKHSILISSIASQTTTRPGRNLISIVRNINGLQLHLFGLGAGEIVLILIGIGVVLGPSGIKNVIKESTIRAVEIKNEATNIPKEFQKGVEIGEIEARSRKAKRIVVNKTTTDDSD